jgi:hypothetical protein
MFEVWNTAHNVVQIPAAQIVNQELNWITGNELLKIRPPVLALDVGDH